MVIDFRKLNKSTRKDHYPLPFIDQMLERLSKHTHFASLMDILVFRKYLFLNLIKKRPLLLVPLELMLIDVCLLVYAMHLLTFQICMAAIFSDFCEKIVKVFMDDFPVYGKSFDVYLSNLDRVLQRCEQTNLVLNWDKCHFMVNEGIVLAHKISERGIEVDKAKVDAIEKILCPKDIKGFVVS